MGYSNGNWEDPTKAVQSTINGETYAVGSRCALGNIVSKGYIPNPLRAGCFKYSCTADGKVKSSFQIMKRLCAQLLDSRQVPAQQQGMLAMLFALTPLAFVSRRNENIFFFNFKEKLFFTLMIIGNTYYTSCPNSCSSKGYCVKGVCECRVG